MIVLREVRRVGWWDVPGYRVLVELVRDQQNGDDGATRWEMGYLRKR